MLKALTFDNVFAANVFVADTFLKRLMGYMFQKIPKYEAIMITPCNSIHTFFMRFNIDVIFIDQNMNIVSIIKDVKPFKVIMPVKGAKAVIEAKTGALGV